MLSQKLEASDALPRELAGYITTEVNRLSALVTEFLDFARPLHAQRQLGEITKVLDRALDIVAARWKGKPVRVERIYAADLPMVPLDESLCEQAFLNLVQNAYEAMEEHGGVLHVELQMAAHEGREGIRLVMQDTGPGVAEKLREEIFNPFVTTKKTGVGLGLSIVSKIVDGHDGFIHVENGAQGGAVFTLFFPLEGSAPDDWALIGGRVADGGNLPGPLSEQRSAKNESAF